MNTQIVETTVGNPASDNPLVFWAIVIPPALVLIGIYFWMRRNRQALLQRVVRSIQFVAGVILVYASAVYFYTAWRTEDPTQVVWGAVSLIIGAILILRVMRVINREHGRKRKEEERLKAQSIRSLPPRHVEGSNGKRRPGRHISG